MSFDLKISEGDIAIGSDGDLQKVENTEKLIQDILKILSTPLGTNVFHRWYGSLLPTTMVGNPFEEEFVIKIASNQIKSALESLQNLQKAQTISEQKVTAAETLAAVKSVEVQRNPVNPTFFTIFITVLSKAFTESTAEISVGL